MPDRRGVGVAVLAAMASMAATRVAAGGSGPTAESCADAAEEAQRLRDRGALVEARERLVECSAASCPAQVRTDCDGWLNDVNQMLPSVVVAVRDPRGRDLPNATLRIDGRTVDSAVTGGAMPLDPGRHSFEASVPGRTARRQIVVVRQGEKNRVILFQLAAPRGSDHRAGRSTQRPVPIGALVLGGVGVVSLGAFTYVAIDGQNRFDRCEREGCSEGTLNQLRVRRAVAWSLLGAGVLSLAASGYWIVIQPSESGAGATASLSVSP